VAIDSAEVRRIARLARLDPDDAEVRRLARDLESILEFVAVLDELGDGGASSTVPGRPLEALRPDERRTSLEPGEALGNATDSAEGFFRVPRSLPE
jgi:aspartyl-tRNA(Asn)/glutamyl-tRNA(Gln) amidotransferase subunit C